MCLWCVLVFVSADTYSNLTYYMGTTNTNSTLAKATEVVTIYMTAIEGVTVPVVTCSSISFDVYGSAYGTSFVANHTVVSGDTNGRLACTFVFYDPAGNLGTVGEVNATTRHVTIGECVCACVCLCVLVCACVCLCVFAAQCPVPSAQCPVDTTVAHCSLLIAHCSFV